MSRPTTNPCGHLRNVETGGCISFAPCNQQPPGPYELARRHQLVAEAMLLIRAGMGEPVGGLGHHLQLMVALLGHLERTLEVVRSHSEGARLVPEQKPHLFASSLLLQASAGRRWALTTLAMLNAREVRHA